MGEKAQRAQEKMAAKQGDFDLLQNKLISKTKIFEEVEKKYDACRATLDEAKKELADYEKAHKLDVAFVAEFRTAMQALPEKFADSEQQNATVFAGWQQNLSFFQDSVNMFNTFLQRASKAGAPIPLMNGAVIPALKMIIRTAATEATRLQAVENGIKEHASRPPRLQNGDPAAKRPRPVLDAPPASAVEIPASLTGDRAPLQN